MKKSYYAIIPADIRYDNDLPAGAKLLYGELTALSNERGYCWATNDYFSKLYKVSNRTVSSWLSRLEKNDYIERKIKYKDGSREVEERRIYITPGNYLHHPHEENFTTPHEENFQDNNTSFNNTSNNIYSFVIDYLNKKANKNYKATTQSTKSKINARLNEGFTLDDFKKVIDIKCKQWKDTDMDKYLRPQTLFGTKFEGYLNEGASAKAKEEKEGNSIYDSLNVYR